MQTVLDEIAWRTHTQLADAAIAVDKKLERNIGRQLRLPPGVGDALHQAALPAAHSTADFALVQTATAATTRHVEISLWQDNRRPLPNDFSIGGS